MPCVWPSNTVFRQVELEVEDRQCPGCGRPMHTCDHRHHRVHSFQGPLHLLSRLVHCPDPHCPGHQRTFSPEAEYRITMPWWSMDWEVFSWIGQRRFSRHWSVRQIREELSDSYEIALSDDTIERAIHRYQTMLAAREQDPARLAEVYREVEDLVLSIDGLQPEKGHETLYVVRELRAKRVWFAESLLSSSEMEVRRLLVQARTWAAQLGRPVRLWISDKQEAFVTGIAAEFPGTPHRYCDNHFLREVAQPVLEQDSHAKVKLRQKVRGLRRIERAILEERPAPGAATAPQGPAQTAGPATPSDSPRAEEATPAEEVVLDYCAAVRGILNDGQGGPLEPAGLRMASALEQVRASLQRNLEQKKKAASKRSWSDSAGASTAASKPCTTRKRSSESTSKRSAK